MSDFEYFVLGLFVCYAVWFTLELFSCAVRVWKRLHKAKRMSYLESCLKCCFSVRDPDEFECLIEYVELLVELGFKPKEINRMVLSCCFAQDLCK